MNFPPHQPSLAPVWKHRCGAPFRPDQQCQPGTLFWFGYYKTMPPRRKKHLAIRSRASILRL